MPIKHPFTSGKADGADATEVQPSNWNDDHVGDNTLDRDLTLVQVLNRVDEVSVYSSTIPANLLGTDGGVKLTVTGRYLNNSGADRTLTIKIKLGATTVASFAIGGIATSANRRKWQWDIYFLNSATAAQKWGGKWDLSHPQSTVLGIGLDHFPGTLYATSSEDTTAGLDIDVTFQHSFASGSLDIIKEIAVVELIPAS